MVPTLLDAAQRVLKGTGFGISCFAVNKRHGLLAIAEKVSSSNQAARMRTPASWHDRHGTPALRTLAGLKADGNCVLYQDAAASSKATAW